MIRRHIPINALRSAAEDWSDFLRMLGNWVLTWQEGLAWTGTPFVQVSTIQRFKGLEHPVVILVELEAIEGWEPARRQMLLYVGLSRASARLYALGGPPGWFEAVEERVFFEAGTVFFKWDRAAVEDK